MEEVLFAKILIVCVCVGGAFMFIVQMLRLCFM